MDRVFAVWVWQFCNLTDVARIENCVSYTVLVSEANGYNMSMFFIFTNKVAMVCLHSVCCKLVVGTSYVGGPVTHGSTNWTSQKFRKRLANAGTGDVQCLISAYAQWFFMSLDMLFNLLINQAALIQCHVTLSHIPFWHHKLPGWLMMHFVLACHVDVLSI